MRSDGNPRRGALSRARNLTLASWKLVLPAAAVLGAGAAIAIGQIPSSNGTITGCANTVGTNPSGSPVPFGELRVIDPSDTTDPNADACIPGAEETVTWNQSGPTGPTGPAGQAGGNGAAGANGANGNPGQIFNNTTFGLQASHSSKLYLKLDGINGSVGLTGTPQGWNQVKNSGGGISPGAISSSTVASAASTGKKQTIEGLIPLSSFAAGDEASAGSQTSGAGAGKAVLQMFVFTKAIDSTSGSLAKDLSNHTVIPTMELIVNHASGTKQVETSTYTLSHVEITEIENTGRNGDEAEQVGGEFAKMSGTVGTGSNSVPFTWNKVTNSSTLTLPTLTSQPAASER
jgi:type VI protein secretion system component Hcp